MSTNKPRCTITFDPNVYRTISRLAELQGISRSAVLGEFLEAMHPPLMRTVAILEAAADAPRQVRDGIRQVVEDMERQLLSSAGDGILQMDMLLADLQRGAGVSPEPSAAEPQRQGEAPKPARPPRSNTGVRFPRGREKGRDHG